MARIVHLRFDESADAIQPRDDLGAIADLKPPATLARPTVTTGMGTLGRARLWGSGAGYEALDAIANATRLRRSMAIELVAYIPWKTTNGTYRLVTRGKGSSAAERELYGLQVVVTGAPGAPVVKMQGRWQRASGAAATVSDVTIVPPDDWLYLAMSREWISATEAIVTYWLNDRRVGLVTSTEADIADGDGGTLLVGCDGTPTGMPAGAKIDEIWISDEAISDEELRQVYRRHFVYPQQGHETLRALVPTGGPFGEVYSSDPSSGIQRELQVEGVGLALTLSKAGELEDDFLPDRAWSTLGRWEKVTGRSSLSTDRIQTRRDRVIAHVRKVHGFTKSEIVKALIGPLALTEAQIELIQYSNWLRDTFDGASLAAYWASEPNEGTIGITGGKVDLDSQAGDDARWNGTVRKRVGLRTTIAESAECEVYVAITPALTDNGAACGGYVFNTTGNAHMFGILRDGGTNKWFHRTIIDGTPVDAIGAAVPAGTVYWLRLQRTAGGAVNIYRAVDPVGLPWEAEFAWVLEFASAATFPNSMDWAGPFVKVDTAPAVSANGADALAFAIYCPKSRDVFNWYVYRDPTLVPTAYDLLGAQQVVNQMAPAHTVGSVIESKSLLCDDAYSRCDREPLGA